MLTDCEFRQCSIFQKKRETSTLQSSMCFIAHNKQTSPTRRSSLSTSLCEMAIHCVLQLSTVDCSCKPPALSQAAAVRAVVQLRMRASLLDLSADVIALLLPHWSLATCQAAACTCSSLHAAFRDALDAAAALLPPLRAVCHKVNTARLPMDPMSRQHGSAVQRCIADATRRCCAPRFASATEVPPSQALTGACIVAESPRLQAVGWPDRPRRSAWRRRCTRSQP